MKRTWNTLGLIFVLGSMVVFGGCDKPRQGAGKTYTFALNYPAGAYALDVDIKMNQSADMAGKPMAQTITMGVEMSADVAEHAPADNYPVMVKFLRHRMAMNQNGETKVESDTSDPAKFPPEPAASAVREMLKMELKMELDPAGKLLKATGAEALTGPQAQAAGFTSEQLAKIAMVAKEILPTKPVTLDDTWDVSLAAAAAIPLTFGQKPMTLTARLCEVAATPEGELATIMLKGTSGLVAQPGMKTEGAVDVDATLNVYVATGVVKDYTMDIHVGNKSEAMGKKMEMKIDSTIKLTMTPKK